MVIRHFPLAGWLSKAVCPIVLITFAACGGGGSSTPGTAAPKLSPPSGGATLVEGSATSILLEWNRVAGASSYKVYLDGEQVSCEEITEGVAPGKYRCVVNGLKPDTSYSVEVSSVDANGNEGSRSEQRTVTTGLAPPTGIEVYNVTTHSLVVEWDTVTDASAYMLYLNERQLERPLTPDATDTGANEARHRVLLGGLTADTAYAVQVAAVYMNGNRGPKSSPVGSRTGRDIAFPTNVRLMEVSADSVTLEWPQVIGADQDHGYNVYVDGGETAATCEPLRAFITALSYRCRLSNLGASGAYMLELSTNPAGFDEEAAFWPWRYDDGESSFTVGKEGPRSEPLWLFERMPEKSTLDAVEFPSAPGEIESTPTLASDLTIIYSGSDPTVELKRDGNANGGFDDGYDISITDMRKVRLLVAEKTIKLTKWLGTGSYRLRATRDGNSVDRYIDIRVPTADGP